MAKLTIEYLDNLESESRHTKNELSNTSNGVETGFAHLIFDGRWS